MSIHEHLSIGLLEHLSREGEVHTQLYKRQLSLFEGDYFDYFPGTGEIPDSLQVMGWLLIIHMLVSDSVLVV